MIAKLSFQYDEIDSHVGDGNQQVIDVAFVCFHHAGATAPPSKMIFPNTTIDMSLIPPSVPLKTYIMNEAIPILLGSDNFDSFGVDATPQINTTALVQEVPVENPNRSNKELDNISVKFDIVNEEPDISNDIRTTLLNNVSGNPQTGIFNSEADAKQQELENAQLKEQEERAFGDGQKTRQARNRELSSTGGTIDL